MVLRPHILNYRRTKKKIDPKMIAQLRQAQSGTQAVRDGNFSNKLGAMANGAAILFISIPALYMMNLARQVQESE